MSVENSVTGASCADAWWLAPPIITAAARAAGLSRAEATARLTRSGPNLFRDHTERALLVQFILRFKNPLV
ncbi:MAG TPA: cation-transporting P-type ATPase, partial [Burkholderiales bacterium]|nr:cation-transporting P-type ATPase [Burkholderiales bacterium]